MKLNPIPKIPRKWIREAMLNACPICSSASSTLRARGACGEWNSVLAPVSLMEAFPGLRAEEARAVCNDWRATYHERRTRPATRPAQA